MITMANVVRLFGAALTAFAVCAPQSAWATCAASIAGTDNIPIIQYDPFLGGSSSATIVVNISQTSDDNCVLGLAVYDASQGNTRYLRSGPDQLKYRLFTQNGVEIINDSGAPSVVVTGNDHSKRVSFLAQVPAGEIGPAGNYASRVTLRLFDLSSSPVQIDRDVDAEIGLTIEPRGQINIAGAAGAPFGSTFGLSRLDFGELAQGAERRAFVQIRATTPVLVRISSRNRGVLLSSAAGNQPGLPYEARFDSELLQLAPSGTVTTKAPPASMSGASYPFSVVITGNPEGFPAGLYEDLITFDISPL